jgi:hypothetical protein
MHYCRVLDKLSSAFFFHQNKSTPSIALLKDHARECFTTMTSGCRSSQALKKRSHQHTMKIPHSLILLCVGVNAGRCMVIRFQLIRSEIVNTNGVPFNTMVATFCSHKYSSLSLLAHHGFLHCLFIQSSRQVPPAKEVR